MVYTCKRNPIGYISTGYENFTERIKRITFYVLSSNTDLLIKKGFVYTISYKLVNKNHYLGQHQTLVTLNFEARLDKFQFKA